jgi:leucyl aminopeptidase (aminopeptidase T)
VVKLETKPNVFRKEIPGEIRKTLTKHRTDIFINLLRGIREETPFRIKLTKMQTRDHKSRLAHCPGITLDMLTDGALALTSKDHKRMQHFARSLIQELSDVERIDITNPPGTDLSIGVEGRRFFTDTIIDWKTLEWMNMPTGEVIVAPLEDSLEGRLVCDMAIGGLGPIKTPVEVTAKKGKVQNVTSVDIQALKQVEDSFRTDARSNIVGEFAFGINPKARFVEEFLEAEKILGTVHIAFGDNSDMPGGKNPSMNHTDLLISQPTVTIVKSDHSRVDILVNGKFRRI